MKDEEREEEEEEKEGEGRGEGGEGGGGTKLSCYQFLFRGDVGLPSNLEVAVSMEDLGGMQSCCVLQQRRELYLHHSIQLHTKLPHSLFLLSDVVPRREAMQECECDTAIALTSMQCGLVACCLGDS